MIHKFPLIDRNGQRVIWHRTGEEGVIVGRGSCAYYVQFEAEKRTLSAYELDYPDECARLTGKKIEMQAILPFRGTQLELFEIYQRQ